MKIHIILLGLVLCMPLAGTGKKPLTKEESAKLNQLETIRRQQPQPNR